MTHNPHRILPQQPQKNRARDPQHDAEEKFGLRAGIATGVFGVLAFLGFSFLPTSTTAEKAYVCGACSVLSIACVTGAGAWRSLRRFSMTVTCLILAFICLAALSIVAQSSNEGQPGMPGTTPSAASGPKNPVLSLVT